MSSTTTDQVNAKGSDMPPPPFNQIFKSSPKYCLYFKRQQPLLTSQMSHHNQFAPLLQLKLSQYYVKGAVIFKYHPS